MSKVQDLLDKIKIQFDQVRDQKLKAIEVLKQKDEELNKLNETLTYLKGGIQALETVLQEEGKE